MGLSLQETKKIVSILKKKNITLIPFYPRVLNNKYQKIISKINKKINHSHLTIDVYYNIDLLENGSHLIRQSLDFLDIKKLFSVSIIDKLDFRNPSFLTKVKKSDNTFQEIRIQSVNSHFFRFGVIKIEFNSNLVLINYEDKKLIHYLSKSKKPMWLHETKILNEVDFGNSYAKGYEYICANMTSRSRDIFIEHVSKAIYTKEIIEKTMTHV